MRDWAGRCGRQPSNQFLAVNVLTDNCQSHHVTVERMPENRWYSLLLTMSSSRSTAR